MQIFNLSGISTDKAMRSDGIVNGIRVVTNYITRIMEDITLSEITSIADSRIDAILNDLYKTLTRYNINAALLPPNPDLAVWIVSRPAQHIDFYLPTFEYVHGSDGLKRLYRGKTLIRSNNMALQVVEARDQKPVIEEDTFMINKDINKEELHALIAELVREEVRNALAERLSQANASSPSGEFIQGAQDVMNSEQADNVGKGSVTPISSVLGFTDDGNIASMIKM